MNKKLQELKDKMSKSDESIILFTRHYGEDYKSLIELGMLMILDKPFVIAIEEGALVGKYLTQLASKTFTFKDMKDFGQKLKEIYQ